MPQNEDDDGKVIINSFTPLMRRVQPIVPVPSCLGILEPLISAPIAGDENEHR